MVNWSALADRTPVAGLKALAAAAALVLAAGGSARAVDLPPAPDLPPAEASAEAFSGWYLRGDLGAGFAAAPEWRPETGPIAPGVPLPLLSPYAFSSFRGETLTPSGTIGAGFGYGLNPWLRLDATFEYRFGARLDALYAVADPARPAATGAAYAVDRLRGGVSSLVALVNVYADLGNYWGVTPFVGAGIGVADNALSGVSDQGLAVSGAGAAIPVGGFFSNAARANFAWALMAGFDVDIAPGLKLELSYRHLDLGPIAVGGAHCFPGAPACAGGGRVSSRGALASNDVRIGLVWLIGEPQAAPVPVVARY